MSNRAGLINHRSEHDVTETTRRFRAAAERAGLTIFAEVDHGENAAEVGLALRPTRLLIFGNPRGGTPLMQINQTAGIDLPFKALIWSDEQGTVWLTYNDPQWLADRHALGASADPIVTTIAAGMEKLAASATV